MAEFGEDVFFATIGELSARLRAREISARELTAAFLQRLEALGPRYNAVACLLRERAMKSAEDVDDELKRGRVRGPLQGIPYGAKDLLAVKGAPTAWGAKPFAGQMLDKDAATVRRLDRARAVLIGKLAMVELAGGGGYRYAASSVSGPGLNPWNRDYWSGGSSSGSGAAVAAGLLPFAIGSETWGSILTPAAYCGVTGLRPTYGLVSRHGAMPLSWTMDKLGPMARSAEDCALVLHEISGGDVDDPASAGKRFHYTPQFARKLPDLKAGFAVVDFEEWAEPPAREAFRRALDVLRETGLQFVETELPDFPYGATASSIIAAEGSAVFEELIQSGGVDELADQRQIAGLKAGLEIKAKDYLRALRVRSLIQQELRKMFYDIDVLISPARFGPASRIGEPLDAERSRPEPKRRGLSGLSAAGNLAGLPALFLPCGFAGGLPVAIQIVGRPFTENTLVAVGKEFQARTDWHRRRPPAA
jgi:aspartyl-tRNA(Asn)/glutamyl-tRNA(Gln) amidotransferase subunit A